MPPLLVPVHGSTTDVFAPVLNQGLKIGRPVSIYIKENLTHQQLPPMVRQGLEGLTLCSIFDARQLSPIKGVAKRPGCCAVYAEEIRRALLASSQHEAALAAYALGEDHQLVVFDLDQYQILAA